MFCAYNVQTLVGAVSPKLVFEGALKQGLAVHDLIALCANDPGAVHNLMW
ncbi:hypothetical protein OG596_26240 [Streptomyces sp. NBC_01102]|nr:hypothetical protein OG596_26240 [Streptomyces sp. NBC_01102]